MPKMLWYELWKELKFNHLIMSERTPKERTPEAENNLEKTLPKVVLHFMRHSSKEVDPDKKDANILLSEEGRRMAAEKFETAADIRHSHAVGSPRSRTQETAVSSMLKTPLGIEEISTRKKQDLIGKSRIDQRLISDINMENPSAYEQLYIESYKAGKFFDFLVNESDAMSGDHSFSYSKAAAQIASIINEAIISATNFNEV